MKGVEARRLIDVLQIARLIGHHGVFQDIRGVLQAVSVVVVRERKMLAVNFDSARGDARRRHAGSGFLRADERGFEDRPRGKDAALRGFRYQKDDIADLRRHIFHCVSVRQPHRRGGFSQHRSRKKILRLREVSPLRKDDADGDFRSRIRGIDEAFHRARNREFSRF